MIGRLLSTAKSEIGYLEKSDDKNLDDKTMNAGRGNFTKYGAWYEGGKLQGQAWCAMFISWSANQAKIPSTIFYPHAYCPYGVTWYKNKGLWRCGAGYVPKPGDVIYFTADGRTAAHVGIVHSSDTSRVYTIEGNTGRGDTLAANGGGVFGKSYTLSYPNILGYASPEYKILGEEEDMTRYSTVEEMPEYARKTIRKLINMGILQGGAKGLDLSEDMIRVFVVNDRAGLYK